MNVDIYLHKQKPGVMWDEWERKQRFECDVRKNGTSR
jgi:hypothetical protein